MLLFLLLSTNACVQSLCAKVSYKQVDDGDYRFVCLVCDILAQKFPEKVSFPSTKVESQKCRDVLPLSLVFVAMIAFNNLCLQEVRQNVSVLPLICN